MRLATALCAAVVTASLAGPTLAAPVAAPNVSLDPKAIGKPPIDSWTTFNGDYSGLDAAECMWLDAALVRIAPWRVVALVEGSGRFTNHYRLYDPNGGFDGGDVADYVIHRASKE